MRAVEEESVPRRSLLVAIVSAIVFASNLAAAPPEAVAGSSSRPQEPQAGSWQTYILTSGSEIFVPAPPRPGSSETQD